MIKKFLLLAGVITSGLAQAQDTALSLQYCLQKARENHPIAHSADYLSASSALKMKNLNKNYLPELNLNGDVHYQSAVTEVPIKIEQFAPEALDKDWYKLSLDISQVIYDGGATRRSKDVESYDDQINRKNVGIEIYKVTEQVTGAYFTILSLRENRNLLDLHRETLQARLNEVESGVRNGVVLASNADILRAELLKIDQRIAENEIGLESAYKILSILVGEDIQTVTPLEMTSPEIPLQLTATNRLEYSLFTLQEQKTESMKSVAASRLMPRLIAYAQAGYGRPGFDMLVNEFDDFYMVGARLNWNIWNWNKTKNEKSILDLNRNIIQDNRNAFSRGMSVELERRQAEIIRYQKLLEKDEEIVTLRTKVVRTYESRLQNGVITATEYITELNAETEALLNMKMHQVQLVRAKYEYLAAAGTL